MSDAESKSGSPNGPPPGAREADEFAHIPDPGRRPPLLALLTIAVAVFLIVRLRHDVSYALSAATPVELGEARTLAAATLDRLPLNRYVRLSGLPERESAVILDPRGAWEFSQLFRLHGTSGRFFVRRSGDPLPSTLAERDVFTGRLMPFKDLSFADSIAGHFADRVTATHFFRADELAAALAQPTRPLALRDLTGERVTLAPTTRLTLDVIRPGEYRVELPRARFAEASAAEARVQKVAQAAGGRVLQRRESPAAWIVTLAIPTEARDQDSGRPGESGPRRPVPGRPRHDRGRAGGAPPFAPGL